MPEIWYNKYLCEKTEIQAIQKYFNSTPTLSGIRSSFVIPRFSVLPFAERWYDELQERGIKAVNTLSQHRFLADILEWYPYLEDVTPKTVDLQAFHSRSLPWPRFIKGRTNSKKGSWSRCSYAESEEEQAKVISYLMQDTWIAQQGLVAREYIELESHFKTIVGQPVAIEWRSFWYATSENLTYLAGGSYWAEAYPELSVTPPSHDFMVSVASRVQDQLLFYGDTSFFVVDFAKTKEGQWIVIELNDGQMSGLNGINPDYFYAMLKKGVMCELI